MKHTFQTLLLATLSALAQANESASLVIGPPDCRISNRHPRQDERATWTGGCMDGYAAGTGVLQWYIGNKPGSRYEGEVKDGKRHGRGILTYPNGDKLSGTFDDGELKGEVNIQYANGNRYNGTYQKGARNGLGTLLYKDGMRYVGMFNNGKREGSGKITLPSGRSYDGEWKADQWEGVGTLIYEDGGSYTGEWLEGKRNGNGNGKRIYAVGGSYEGQWKDEKYDGHGLITYPGGRRVAAHFKNGIPVDASIPTPAGDLMSIIKPITSLYRTATAHIISSGVTAPPNRAYDNLTDQQKREVNAIYPLMDELDEPPYPLRGPDAIHVKISTAFYEQKNFGHLELNALISADGKAESVSIIQAPSEELGEIARTIIMRQPFKPAKCADKPCAMIYPLRLHFTQK